MTWPTGVSSYRCQYFLEGYLAFQMNEVCEFLHYPYVGFPCMMACQTCVNCSLFAVSFQNHLQLWRATHICASSCSLWMTNFQRKHGWQLRAETNFAINIKRNEPRWNYLEVCLHSLWKNKEKKQNVDSSRICRVDSCNILFREVPSEVSASSVHPSLLSLCKAKHTENETQTEGLQFWCTKSGHFCHECQW